MATNIIKIIDSQDKVVSQTQITSGKSITVSAKEGQSYEFVSGATKRAPDEIKTTREGNNLKVEIKDGEEVSTTIIEDYYTNGEGDLVGLAEDGHYYNFVPEEMGNDYMVTDLADGVTSFQALGSEGDSMTPWWLGLPLLALGAAGGGGGSGSANTLPDAPNLLMVEDDNDNTSVATGVLWGADDDRGSWSIDSATGDITTNGNVNLVDGKIITNDSTPGFSGTGEAGTTVRVYDGAVDPDNLVAETTVDSDGNWEITTDSYIRALQETPLYLDNGDENSPLQNAEHTLNITLANGTGNESNPTSIDMIVDTIGFYDMAHIALNKGQDDGRSDVGGEVTGTDSHYYSGSFTISDDLIKEAGVQEKEIVSYQVDDEIYVTLVNQETGDEYCIAERNSPGVDDAPTGYSAIVTDSSTGWSVTVDFTQEYYNATTGNWETLPDGNYASKVLVHEVSGDIYVHSSSNQIDDNGTPNDTTDDTSYGIFGIDRVAPDASQVVSQTLTNNHTLTINVVDSTPIYWAAGDISDGLHSGSDYLVGAGVSELFVYRDGVEVGTKNITGEISLTNWTDDTSLADGVYMYQIDSVDVAGNHSGLGGKSWVLFDSNNDHDLTNADVAGKDFNEMVLVGNSNSETFTLDNVGFDLINAAGGITDTFVLQDGSGSLDITQTQNFEVYNMGDNTLNIGSSVVDGNTDHVIINGTGDINLDDSWGATGTTTGSYTVYASANSVDDLWIETSNVGNVHI